MDSYFIYSTTRNWDKESDFVSCFVALIKCRKYSKEILDDGLCCSEWRTHKLEALASGIFGAIII